MLFLRVEDFTGLRICMYLLTIHSPCIILQTKIIAECGSLVSHLGVSHWPKLAKPGSTVISAPRREPTTPLLSAAHSFVSLLSNTCNSPFISTSASFVLHSRPNPPRKPPLLSPTSAQCPSAATGAPPQPTPRTSKPELRLPTAKAHFIVYIGWKQWGIGGWRLGV